MFGRGVTAVLIVLALLVAGVGPAGAQLLDTPWPKFMYDLQNTGKTAALGPSTAPVHTKWTNKITNSIRSQPGIGPDGTVYVGVTSQPLCAFDGDTGALKWCTGATADGNSSSPAIGEPVPGQPGTVDHSVFLGARDNKLWAVNDDGSVAWAYKIQLDGDIMSSPAIVDDGTIYMSCGCLSAGIVWAMNPEGTVKWSLKIGKPINNSAVAISKTTPAGAVRRLYIGARDGSLVAIDDKGASGKVAWTLLPNKKKTNNYNSSPAIDKNGHIYWGSALGLFAASDNGSTATLLWSRTPAGTVDTTPAIDNDAESVIVSSYKTGKRTLYAYDFDGNQVWTPLTGPSTPVALHQQSPNAVIDAGGNVFVGIGKKVYAFNSAGAQLWNYVLPADVVSMAIGDSTLYVGGEDRVLYALVSSP
jgi:outer membrane protein assembly factor BamB